MLNAYWPTYKIRDMLAFKGNLIFSKALEKYSDIKFHCYLLLNIRVVPCGKIDMAK